MATFTPLLPAIEGTTSTLAAVERRRRARRTILEAFSPAPEQANQPTNSNSPDKTTKTSSGSNTKDNRGDTFEFSGNAVSIDEALSGAKRFGNNFLDGMDMGGLFGIGAGLLGIGVGPAFSIGAGLVNAAVQEADFQQTSRFKFEKDQAVTMEDVLSGIDSQPAPSNSIQDIVSSLDNVDTGGKNFGDFKNVQDVSIGFADVNLDNIGGGSKADNSNNQSGGASGGFEGDPNNRGDFGA